MQAGVSTTTFAVVFCSVVIIILLAAAYVVVSDRINGLDAYRVREMRDQRDGYKSVCEENYKASAILKEWLMQQGIKPPPDLMVQKNCIQPSSIETEHK